MKVPLAVGSVRRRVVLAMIVAVATGVITAVVTTPPGRVFAGAFAALAVVALYASVEWFATLTKRFSIVSSLCGLCLSWAVVAFCSALLSPRCPSRGAYSLAGRCTPSEAAQMSLVALMTPLALGVFVLPGVFGVRLAVRFIASRRERSAGVVTRRLRR